MGRMIDVHISEDGKRYWVAEVYATTQALDAFRAQLKGKPLLLELVEEEDEPAGETNAT